MHLDADALVLIGLGTVVFLVWTILKSVTGEWFRDTRERRAQRWRGRQYRKWETDDG